MITELSISQLRGFDSFRMSGLGRVNLLVGTNNSGKTTVLEAIQLLASPGDTFSIFRILSRRGEDWWDATERRRIRHVDVRRLFCGHEIKKGSQFEILASVQGGKRSFVGKIIDAPTPRDSIPPLLSTPSRWDDPNELLSDVALRLTWDEKPETDFAIPITRHGGLSADLSRKALQGFDTGESVRFISSAALSPESVVELFESVVLTADEPLVIEALNIIDPSIERIATSSADRLRLETTRGGVIVKCRGIDQRIPIGSMGDGIWRILGIALALVRSGGGVLLIDEIDTGLHYSVMADMWKLLFRTAKRLNVQVFATTHSRDCYESLAVICRDEASQDDNEITIQRLEKNKKRAVAYTEQEIVAAAERGMEVR